MKMHTVILASAALLLSNIAFAQQYDSLGSPTPAPNQRVSPNSSRPNVPASPGAAESTSGTTDQMETNGSSSTTGATSTPANGGVNGPVNTGTTTPTDTGAVRNGLPPD
jgi:hypothetical protein